MTTLPDDWQAVLAPMLATPKIQALFDFVAAERRSQTVYPPEELMYTALRLTPLAAVRVVIVGQDPYHGPGQAHGLAFSVQRSVKAPPSLRNMLKELHDDLGCPTPRHGDLSSWASQGVLLLNRVLTVRDGEPASHAGHGWEQITEAIIRAVNDRPTPAIFVLWGRPAQTLRPFIDETRHTIIEAAHPSPLSAKRGFFGSRPYSKINAALSALGQTPIDWCLPQA